jgi:hypothetical protein
LVAAVVAVVKYPPDNPFADAALRYGSPRDLELTRLDEERCERRCRTIRAWWNRIGNGRLVERLFDQYRFECRLGRLTMKASRAARAARHKETVK